MIGSAAPRRRTPLAPVASVLAALVVSAVLAGYVAAPAATASPGGCTAETAAPDRPRLTRGDEGGCVAVAQLRLVQAGYDVPTDGRFDEAMQRAVRRFQASFDGLPIDGVIGTPTWQALEGDATPYAMNHGPNTGQGVVLSFDDCPNSLAEFKETVRAAEGLGIALVLFPYGDCIGWGKIDVAYARAHGHYVFSHSATHPHLNLLGRDAAIAELGPPAVQGAYGRPPYGAWNWTVKDAFATRGMRMWGWTLDTLDWTEIPRAAVVDAVVAQARAGDTVLMHMQYAAFNAAALAAMRDGLATRGLAVCANRGPVASTSAFSC